MRIKGGYQFRASKANSRVRSRVLIGRSKNNGQNISVLLFSVNLISDLTVL